ncbi:Uncharacterized protein PPKH_2168 [Pseudomonas putida]|nr:Uncharacterized protein PPKH_2168 [Pseudomonas putida]
MCTDLSEYIFGRNDVPIIREKRIDNPDPKGTTDIFSRDIFSGQARKKIPPNFSKSIYTPLPNSLKVVGKVFLDGDARIRGNRQDSVGQLLVVNRFGKRQQGYP